MVRMLPWSSFGGLPLPVSNTKPVSSPRFNSLMMSCTECGNHSLCVRPLLVPGNGGVDSSYRNEDLGARDALDGKLGPPPQHIPADPTVALSPRPVPLLGVLYIKSVDLAKRAAATLGALLGSRIMTFGYPQ